MDRIDRIWVGVALVAIAGMIGVTFWGVSRQLAGDVRLTKSRGGAMEAHAPHTCDDAGSTPAPATILFRVSAFCPGLCCCGKWADEITASGTRAGHPLVAAPPEIPFGTRVRIPGYANGEWIRVEDRGGAIQGFRLDVLFPTHSEALQWGVRYLNVEIKGDDDGAQ